MEISSKAAEIAPKSSPKGSKGPPGRSKGSLGGPPGDPKGAKGPLGVPLGRLFGNFLFFLGPLGLISLFELLKRGSLFHVYPPFWAFFFVTVFGRRFRMVVGSILASFLMYV